MTRYLISFVLCLTVGSSCGNGTTAKDPCDDDTVCAGQNRVCINNQGIAECGDCLPGYSEDNGDCVADVTCGANTCSGHGSCDDSGGTPVCTCDTGYTGDYCGQCASGYEDPGDGSCQPVDPCAGDTVCAGQNRECVNNQGTAECGDCLPGFADLEGVCVRQVCTPGESSGDVQAPVFLYNLPSYATGWYASPVVADLDGNGSNELITADYSVFVYDQDGVLIDEADPGEGRIFAPHLVADIDGDTGSEVVFGAGTRVHAYEWIAGALQPKTGWPADAGINGEVRGLAAADLDGNGSLEVIATTAATPGDPQVFVFSPDGSTYQPAGLGFPAWPRYNDLTGDGGDADRNGPGHHSGGCYGLNVGAGNLDDDPELEIIVTDEAHHIQAFDHDGVAIDSSPWFSNRTMEYLDMPLTWGQFFRWVDPQIEENNDHLHTGDWPDVSTHELLQWGQSPPNLVDLDGDGLCEVVAIPEIEFGGLYETQAFAVMVLEGAHGDGSRSARRKAGWETLPRGASPIPAASWIPAGGVPAPTTVDIQGDSRPEIITSLNDTHLYAFDAEANQLWSYDYSHSKPVMYASEVTVSDLNQDGFPELVFCTYGDPDVSDSGYLVILSADGSELFDLPLPDPGVNGNAIGAFAAPSIYDLDGDGQLEILVQTVDHGIDVFSIPDSGTHCVLWPSARGGATRTGSVDL